MSKNTVLGPAEFSNSEIVELAAYTAMPGWSLIERIVATNRIHLGFDALVPGGTAEEWQRKVQMNAGAYSVLEDLLLLKQTAQAKADAIKGLDNNKPKV